MKRNFFYMLLGAALGGALLSCVREEVNENPDYNPETKQVTAQFVLSVDTGGSPDTKMEADRVQQGTSFLGIDNVTLFAYNTGLAAPYVNKTDGTGLSEYYDFGVLYASNAIDMANNESSSSRRVLKMSVPVGTDAALFYGKAVNTTPGAANGQVDVTIDKAKPSGTHFDAVKRLGDNETAYNKTAELMIFVVNRIIGSEVTAATADYNGFPKEDLPALTWAELGHQFEINNATTAKPSRYEGAKATLTPLEASLGEAYYTFTYIKTGEYRAGSSDAIKEMMKGMYSVVTGALAATPTNAKEANAKRLAAAIETRMLQYFQSNWLYKENDAIKDVVEDVLGTGKWVERGFNNAQSLNDYPHEFRIPVGAAQLDFTPASGTTPDAFSYLNPNKPLVNLSATSFSPSKYLYPVELMYYVNSPIRVTDKANLTNDDFPNGTSPWSTWGKEGWTSPGVVLSTTRGIAVRDNINYGVALLSTSVDWGYQPASTTYITQLKDNRIAMTGDPTDQTINVSDAGLVLKGVLVGGVASRMGWNYVQRRNSGDETSFDNVIYDDVMAGSGSSNAGVAIPTSEPNYTLVFDNYNVDGQSDVYVALEIQNNGVAFWGKDNLVPAGGIFYLVGKLQNASGGEITWPTDYQIPPIYGVDGEAVPDGKTAGQSKQISRVFIQDYMTSVMFRIGTNSLKNAYVTVPDLQSTQMSLGLSVDINWRNGYSYDIEL